MPLRYVRLRLSCLVPAVGLLALAACTDRNPAAPAPGLPAGATAVLRCEAVVRAAAVTCGRPGAAPGASAVILGGQGINVRLASSGTSYDAKSEILRTQVTVQNLTAQPLAAAGDTAALDGVRVFFQTGPNVTAGSGAVTVANADGEASFTAGVQKFFEYPGVLVTGATSAPREWRFSVPPGVTSFVFTVYVAAQVRAEAGWIGVTPLAPSLMVGDTQRLAAAVRGVTGRDLTAQPVAWWSSNPSVARVDTSGLVTAVAAGTVFITATSGGRAGRAELEVTDGYSPLSPTITRFDLDRTTLQATWADSLTVRVAAKAGGAGVGGISVWLLEPDGNGVYVCDSFTLVSGAANDGTFQCRVPFEPYSRRGAWRVNDVTVLGSPYGRRSVGTGTLLAAGAPTWVRVENDYDVTPPVLHSFTLSPTTVSPTTAAGGEKEVNLDFAVTDSGGVDRVTVTMSNPASTFPLGCTTPQPYSGSDEDGTFRCVLVPYATIPGGEWTVSEVRLEDNVGNVSVLKTADLEGAGYNTHLQVNTSEADTVPPTLTAFTYGASVVGNTRSALFVNLGASGGQTGILALEAVFQRVGGTQTRTCTYPHDQFSSSVSTVCVFQFDASEAGTWRVEHVYALDGGNARTFGTAELQAAGFRTMFTVVAP